MIPKYAQMPFDAKAMAVFDLQRRAAAGEIQVDDREVERITAAYARTLRESLPPATTATSGPRHRRERRRDAVGRWMRVFPPEAIMVSMRHTPRVALAPAGCGGTGLAMFKETLSKSG